MAEKQIREDLQKLRSEIATLHSDNAEKAALSQLVADIEEELNDIHSEGTVKRLAAKLESKVNELEASHPTVTGILNSVMVTLSGMGV